MIRHLLTRNVARRLTSEGTNVRYSGALTTRTTVYSNQQQQRFNHHNRSLSSHNASMEWEQSTRHLLELPQWKPGHKRKAQQCFEHWSRQKIGNNHSNNNASKRDMIAKLWIRTQREVPQQETAAAMYDYAILSLAKNGFAFEALTALEAYLTTTFRIRGERHIPSSYHLNAVLHALSRSRQAERAEELLLKMYNQYDERNNEVNTHADTVATIQPNVYSVTSVLDGWSRMGQGGRAQALLDDCIANRGLEATVACYNAVLTAWSRTHSNEARQRAQHIMKTMPVPPDAASWSSYLIACKDPTEMETVLWEAYRNGEPVNAVCFNVVLNAWGKAGKVHRAQDFLTNWIALIASDDANRIPRTLWPQLSSFNTLLNPLSKSGNDDKIKYWLAEMDRLGVAPDDISYNCWIGALAYRGKVKEAEEVFVNMGQNMDRKNQAYACNTILNAYGNYARRAEYKGDIIDRACAFAKTMEERGIGSTVITYNSLLKVMASCGEPERAKDLLRNMKSGPVKPDIVSYSIVIDAYAKARRPVEAHDIHRFMTVPPNVVSFNCLIHAYSKSDAPEFAERANSVLKDMVEASVTPDLMTYCSLLTVWSNSNHADKASRARATLDSMVASYNDLARLHRNSEELMRNAQTMVVASCAYLPATDSTNMEEAHQIARRTFAEIQQPTYISYATYMLALHRLDSNKQQRYDKIREVFLSYCQQETNREINPLVLRRLEMVTPSNRHTELLQEGQRIHGGQQTALSPATSPGGKSQRSAWRNR